MKELQTEAEMKVVQMDHGLGAPRYAIVRLAPKDDVFNLFRLLVQNGYHEVSFVNGLKDTVLPWPLANVVKGDVNSRENGTNSMDSSENSIKIGESPPVDSNSDSEGGTNGQETDSGGFTHNSTSVSSVVSEAPMVTTAPLPQLLLSTNRLNGYSAYPNSSTMSTVAIPPPISSLIPSFPHPPSLGMANFFSQAARGVQLPATVTREVITPPYSMPNQVIIPTTNCGMPFFQKYPGLHHPSQQPPPLQISVPSHHMQSTGSAMIPTSLHSGASVNPLTTPATTQLRQRGSRAQSDDPSVYVACKLCNNKIMASRLSNLTNHVRRHSTLKQFQCCYCDYTHNEMAKVRLHMLHNHKDKDSQPIDNLSPEMQASWDVLMQQCFPDHYQGGQASGNPASNKQLHRSSCPDGKLVQQASVPENVKTKAEFPVLPDTPFGAHSIGSSLLHGEIGSHVMIRPCFECGEIVIPADRLEHIRQCHMECYPYVCSLCGYDHPDQGKVLLHINIKHGESTSAQLFTRDITIVAEALIPKYFPEHDGSPVQITSPIQNQTECQIAPVKPESKKEPVESLQQSEFMPALVNLREPNVKVSRMETGDFQMHSIDSYDQFTTGSEDLRCQLCRKVLDGIRPLSSLLNHAKRHYHVKQFHCSDCTYSSSEAAHVRSHMKLKHNIRGKLPLDNRSAPLQQAWIQTMTKCFPTVAPRLKKFRFKNFRAVPSGRPKTDGAAETDTVEHRNCSSSEPILIGRSSFSESFASEKGRHPSVESSGSDGGNYSAGKSNSPSSLVNLESNKEESFRSSDLPLNKRQCHLCERWVSTEDLFPHATSHITLKPFGCSVCPFRTSDYQHLRAHLWKHKLIAGGERHKARIAANSADINSIRNEYVSYCFGNV